MARDVAFKQPRPSLASVDADAVAALAGCVFLDLADKSDPAGRPGPAAGDDGANLAFLGQPYLRNGSAQQFRFPPDQPEQGAAG